MVHANEYQLTHMILSNKLTVKIYNPKINISTSPPNGIHALKFHHNLSIVYCHGHQDMLGLMLSIIHSYAQMYSYSPLKKN